MVADAAAGQRPDRFTIRSTAPDSGRRSPSPAGASVHGEVGNCILHSAFQTQSSKIPLFHHSMRLTKRMVAKSTVISINYRNSETLNYTAINTDPQNVTSRPQKLTLPITALYVASTQGSATVSSLRTLSYRSLKSAESSI